MFLHPVKSTVLNDIFELVLSHVRGFKKLGNLANLSLKILLEVVEVNQHEVGLVATLPPSSNVAPKRPTNRGTGVIFDEINQHIPRVLARPFKWGYASVFEKAVKGGCCSIEVVVKTPDHVSTVAGDEDVLDFRIPYETVDGQVCLHETPVCLSLNHFKHDLPRDNANVNPW
ncbi:hypothetical protein HG531_009353 [Fusarium graminearum]|nr:hypothetical protein HG531_009353 [Fusarium graminearum]